MRKKHALPKIENLITENILHVRELVLKGYNEIGTDVDCDYNEFFEELESRYLNAWLWYYYAATMPTWYFRY